MAAKFCAKGGMDVILLEKKAEIGAPLRCAEGVSKSWLDEVGIKPEPAWIRGDMKGAIIKSTKGTTYQLDESKAGNEVGYVLERHLFDKALARDAAKAGAKIMMRTSCTGVIREDGKYTKLESETLDLALIVHAEHGGGNNSSFVTHVVTSAFTDIYSSLAASILSLKGSRHGGANLRVMRQMDEIKQKTKNWRDAKQVGAYLEKIADRKAGDGTGLIYGLGHAVYTISDPRAQLLKRKARELAKAKGRMDEMRLFELVESEGPAIIKSRHPRAEDVCANVDLYSGFVYEMLGIPRDLYTPLFAIARCVSWCAHRMEELVNNGPIIRPAYKPLYRLRDYVPLKDRRESR